MKDTTVSNIVLGIIIFIVLVIVGIAQLDIAKQKQANREWGNKLRIEGKNDGLVRTRLVQDPNVVRINEKAREFVQNCKTPAKLFYVLNKDFQIIESWCASEKFDLGLLNAELLDYK